MELRRTANAGFLLTLDGAKIAMDGVCLAASPYQATPPAELSRFAAAPPDLLAFTHCHGDHLDPAAAAAFPGPILGSEQVAQLLPGKSVSDGSAMVKGVRIMPVATRHIGKSCLTTVHRSFIIEGAKRVWFMGDAAPTQMALLSASGAPDVLIAPFAYATTPSAVRMVNEAAPRLFVLTHLPARDNDPAMLWDAVTAMLPQLHMPVLIPEIGEIVTF